MDKKKCFLTIMLIMFLVCSLYATEWVTGQIIVELQDHIRGGALNSFISNYQQYELVEDEYDYSTVRFNTRLFHFDHELIDEIDFLEMIRNDPLVLLAQFNFIYEMEIPESLNVSAPIEQWALENKGQIIDGQPGVPGADISAIDAWKIVDILGDLNPYEIQVAVIDDGYYLLYPELIFGTPYNAVNVGFATDTRSHGTHVSGIIGGNGIGEQVVYGASPSVTIIPIQGWETHPTINPNIISISTNALIRAMDYIYEQIDFHDAFVVAVNLSMRGFEKILYDDLNVDNVSFRQRIIALGDLGVLTIFAAGNDSTDLDRPGQTSYLPDLPYLLGVANTNNRDELHYSYDKDSSNYGLSTVHLGAPGTMIISTDYDEKFKQPKYDYKTGTSMSAPHVSGTVALMYRVVGVDLLNEYSSNPGGLALLVKEKLLDGVDPIPSLDGKTITGGRLNAKNAVLGVLNKFERITEDKTIDNEATVDLKKFMLVSSSVIIEDAIITPITHPELSRFYGFELYYSSQLELINTTLYLEDGFIRLDEGSELILDENSKIYISGGSISIAGPATVTMLNGSEMILSDASISLDNNTTMSVLDSSIHLSDSILTLDGSSILHFQDSQFTTQYATQIIGNKAPPVIIDDWVDPIDDTGFITPQERGVGFNYGDRIIFENTVVNIGEETTITSGSSAKWTGLYFLDCLPPNTTPPTKNIFKATVDTISTILIENSIIEFIGASITNSGQINVIENSDFRFIDSIYSFNNRPMTIENSNFLIYGADINDNQFGGIRISGSPVFGLQDEIDDVLPFIPTPFFVGNIEHSNIMRNYKAGVEILQGSVSISESVISENYIGISSLSTIPIYVSGNTIIEDNTIGVSALGQSFPYFYINPVTVQKPLIKSNLNPNEFNWLLLIANGIFTPKIDVSGANIAPMDPFRIRPSMADFNFGLMVEVEHDLYLSMLDNISANLLRLALEIAEEIIADYSTTLYAKNSIAILPFLYKELELDANDLIYYLEEIDEVFLSDIVLQTTAFTYFFNSDYEDAIDYFGLIISEPPSTIEGFVAEYWQMWSHYLATQLGSRNIPDIAVHQPSSYTELSLIEENILSKIRNLMMGIDIHEGQTPEPLRIDLQNYPNPFNPETTIFFTNPTSGSVILEIFNIRGQKVRTLVNDVFPAGQHEIIWNGTNDHGREQASGLYFYRLQAAGQTLTKRMVLLK